MKPRHCSYGRICWLALGILFAAGGIYAAGEGGENPGVSVSEPAAGSAEVRETAETGDAAEATAKVEAAPAAPEGAVMSENPSSGETADEKTEAAEETKKESSKEILANPDAVLTPESGQSYPWNQNRVFWERSYHRQVTPGIFELIQYPYYPGGKAFDPEVNRQVVAGRGEAEDKVSKTAEKDVDSTPAASEGCMEAQAAAKTETPASAEAKKNDLPGAEVSATGDLGEDHPLEDVYEIVRLIHQWRNMNESESFALEVLRAVELTRTSTRIYQIKPELAIAVKRTLGGIGIANLKVDKTIREVLKRMADKQDVRYELSHLKKLLADLESSLTLLADQNDKISMELGLGKINRDCPFENAGDSIRFSYIPQTTEWTTRSASSLEAPSKR